MFVGRNVERRQLEEMYNSDKNKLIILYGREGMGKTTLMQEFMQDKHSLYYQASECIEREQLYLFSGNTEQTYQEIFQAYLLQAKEQNNKALIVLDEFQWLTGSETTCMNAIEDILKKEKGLMVVLISSSVRWIENEMVHELPSLTPYITTFIKLKELPFVEVVNYFKNLSVEQSIYVNAFFGGIPKYLESFDETKGFKENLYHLMFQKNAVFSQDAEHLLKCELRELTAYNTILHCLASGQNKLNDIHHHTGFSRAKISVYLKNLIQLDIVEKIFSFDTKQKEQVQKGMYRIQDTFINAWYRYVFPNQSMIAIGKGKEIYEHKVLPSLEADMREHFAKVCNEFLKLMNQHHRLGYDFVTWNGWWGKNGLLDMVAADSSNHYLVTNCKWSSQVMEAEQLKLVQQLSMQAGIRPNLIYLFSKSGFSQELQQMVKKEKGIHLIELSDL